MEGQALLPERVELIQHVQLGVIFIDPVEHLHAGRHAHGQQERQVVIFQGHGVQVQGAIAGQFFAEVGDQRVLGGQRNVGGLAGHQFHHMVVLLHLQQIAMVGLTQQQVLRGIEDFLNTLRDKLRTVVTEAAHPQARQMVRWQLVEVIP